MKKEEIKIEDETRVENEIRHVPKENIREKNRVNEATNGVVVNRGNGFFQKVLRNFL